MAHITNIFGLLVILCILVINIQSRPQDDMIAFSQDKSTWTKIKDAIKHGWDVAYDEVHCEFHKIKEFAKDHDHEDGHDPCKNEPSQQTTQSSTDLPIITPNNGTLIDRAVIAYEVHQELKTWDEANDYCLENGMILASFILFQQHVDIKEYLAKEHLLPNDTNSGYWAGGRNINGHWKWIPVGIDIRDDMYFMAGWHEGEPNRRQRNGDKQNCLELKYVQDTVFTESLAWNDMWCDEMRGFICQYNSF